MNVKTKLLIASLLCLANLVFIIYFMLTPVKGSCEPVVNSTLVDILKAKEDCNSFISNLITHNFVLGYFIGFSSYSVYFLRDAIKEYRKEVERLWSGLTKSTTS